MVSTRAAHHTACLWIGSNSDIVGFPFKMSNISLRSCCREVEYWVSGNLLSILRPVDENITKVGYSVQRDGSAISIASSPTHGAA